MVKAERLRHVESSQEIYNKFKERFVKRYGWFIPNLHDKHHKIKLEKFEVKDTKRD
jgi:hypothetical protein